MTPTPPKPLPLFPGAEILKSEPDELPIFAKDLTMSMKCGCKVTFVAGSPNHGQLRHMCSTHCKWSPFDQLRLIIEAGKLLQERRDQIQEALTRSKPSSTGLIVQ